MRKAIAVLILICTFNGQTLIAQTGLYLGYENGTKWDRFSYIDSKGNSLNTTSFNGILGGYVGYKFDRFSFETGFYCYYTRVHMYDYYRNTRQVSKSMSSYGSSNLNNFIIPLRFGTEFTFWKNRLFVKPEIGITGIIARGNTNIKPNGWWAENTRHDTTFIPTTGDSTIAFTYRTSKLNLGFETSISAGFRIINKIDIYFKGGYCNSLKPLYYETITFYSDNGNVTATNTFHGNAFFVQIGLRYYFNKRK